jgi:hypothetical protein
LEVKRLKGGKGFNAPAIFLNPQTKQDGAVLRTANDSFPNDEAKYDGIRSIDGLVIDLKDWFEVLKVLNWIH